MAKASLETKPDPAALRLFLLGSFRLECEGRMIHLPTRKAESLFAFLALFPESHHREKLAAGFWSDVPDEQARTSLRSALAALRKELGEGILIADRETIQLNPDHAIWVDARAFEQSVADDPTSAVSLYQSSLLPDFYDDWIAPERERLRILYLETLLQLAQQARSESKYARAIELARHVLLTDPASEKAHQHLMFCFAATGNRATALKQYDDCKRVLRDELNVEPSTETTALYRKIRAEETGSQAKEALLSNLPILLTSFVGRERELTELKELVGKTRLLTLTGAGGCGKTRLAIQMATELAVVDRFKHGEWWVDLALLSDPTLVTQSVALVFNLSESPGMTLMAVLTDYLRSKELLLVIDNCEHLLGACAQLIGMLLSACPKIRILTTSREALNISGEVVWRVPSLALPDPVRIPPLAQLRQYDAIQLFAERATAVAANWHLVENAAPAVQVCARLDGIPLAIELAAARLPVLSAQEIAARLDDRFNLLTGGSRAGLPRHQTLRATMDWSYDLLSDAERALLRRLSVFAGGFSLEAVGIICAGATSPAPLLDLLSALVHKSLVVVETRGDETRYRLLETVRQYAREKLVQANEADAYARRHRDWFLQRAEQIDPHVRSRDQLVWCDRLERDMENYRAALTSSLEQSDDTGVESAQRLAGALWWFWLIRGYWNEARTWLERSLDNRVVTPTRAWPLVGLAVMEHFVGNTAKCAPLFEEGLALFREQGDLRGTAFAASLLGSAVRDPARASALFDEARETAQELNDEWLAARTDIGQGMFYDYQGQSSRALLFFESALKHARKAGDRWFIRNALDFLGAAVFDLGENDRAAKLFAESLAVSRELGNKNGIAMQLTQFGKVALRRRDYHQAYAFFEQGLALRREMGNTRGILECLWEFAELAAAEEQYTRAAQLLGVAAPLHEMLNVRESRAYEDDMRAIRARLGEAAFDQAHAEGRGWSLEQAIENALE